MSPPPPRLAPTGEEALSGRLPSTVHLVRHGLYRDIHAFFRDRRPTGYGVTVSDTHAVLPSLVPGVRFWPLRWPEHDLQRLDHLPDASVDFVASDMVLEHVQDPRAVFDASWRVLRPGGWALHTTVFMMPHHPCPIDGWRFSPEGLGLLAHRFSEVHAAGSGNRRLVWAVTLGLSRVPVPLWGTPVGALFAGGDRRFAVCTWVAARK